MLFDILQKAADSSKPVQNFNMSQQASASQDPSFLNKIFMSSKLGRNYYSSKAARDQLNRQQMLQQQLPDIMSNADPSDALRQLASLDPSFIDEYVNYQAQQPILDANLNLINARTAAASRPRAKTPFEGALEYIAGLEASGAPKDAINELTLRAYGLQENKGDAPASVREYNFYSELSPEQKKEYLKVKRSQDILNLGGQYAVLDPNTNKIVQEYEKTLSPENRPETREQQASAAARGAATGEKQSNIGSVVEKAEYMLDTIDSILADQEGLSSVTGGPAGLKGLQGNIVPITPAQRRMKPLLDQLQGQTFLDAYQSLKGGGQITEIEGKKAEQAKARLNTAQSTDDYIKALNDLKSAVSKGLERAKREANGSATPSGWMIEKVSD